MRFEKVRRTFIIVPGLLEYFPGIWCYWISFLSRAVMVNVNITAWLSSSVTDRVWIVVCWIFSSSRSRSPSGLPGAVIRVCGAPALLQGCDFSTLSDANVLLGSFKNTLSVRFPLSPPKWNPSSGLWPHQRLVFSTQAQKSWRVFVGLEMHLKLWCCLWTGCLLGFGLLKLKAEVLHPWACCGFQLWIVLCRSQPSCCHLSFPNPPLLFPFSSPAGSRAHPHLQLLPRDQGAEPRQAARGAHLLRRLWQQWWVSAGQISPPIWSFTVFLLSVKTKGQTYGLGAGAVSVIIFKKVVAS